MTRRKHESHTNAPEPITSALIDFTHYEIGSTYGTLPIEKCKKCRKPGVLRTYGRIALCGHTGVQIQYAGLRLHDPCIYEVQPS